MLALFLCFPFHIFSLEKQASLHRVKEYWIPEVQKKCPKVPVILVGTKRDLRDESRRIGDFVRECQGRILAQKHKLKGFVECSAKMDDMVDQVFHTLISNKK